MPGGRRPEGPRGRSGCRSALGRTLLETVFVVSLVAVTSASAVALAGNWRSRSRIDGAARLVIGQIRLARAQALKDGRQVALVFADEGADVVFRPYGDGNDNGVRRADIDRGVDPPLGDTIRLAEWFAGSRLAVAASLPPIEDGAPVSAGSDPVRLAGSSRILSCGPTGSTTSGTLYLAGPRGEAVAIRLLGTTGRLRLFELDRRAQTWRARW